MLNMADLYNAPCLGRSCQDFFGLSQRSTERFLDEQVDATFKQGHGNSRMVVSGHNHTDGITPRR